MNKDDINLDGWSFHKNEKYINDLLKRISELTMENSELKKHRLELIMENAELKDQVLDNGGEYAETDGYEVGSPSDYEEDKQLSLDFEIEKTSDNDFEIKYEKAKERVRVNYGREAEDTERTVVDTGQMSLFND